MRVALAFALALPLAGCAGVERTWRPDVFGPGRTIAVVSICYDQRLLAMRDSEDLPYREADANAARGSADLIVAAAKRRLLDTLASTGPFVLMPEERVLPALRSALVAERRPPCVPAPGYAGPRTPSEASALARQLGADVGITVWMYFGVQMTGVEYASDAAGSARGRVLFWVAAVDRDGRVVWRDIATGGSRTTFWSRWSTLDEDRLFVPLQEAAAEATDRLVSRLRERVGRRATSSPPDPTRSGGG